ncbi:Glycosyl transferase family 2 [Polaromonas sp. YR568]|uniref:glycosyltransferase n=1 Tax=Polaromonas sp. YR568 TaxID=1855301 RepID=UPI0008E7AF71|nr:glycosyltransferase [Polaromonas sp. YR568]SFU91751.1 Glycosyl transferase family 2 [Polaromonas sp. YR568]
MNSTPLVSLVVPAYNHADYLKECIESILAQDYPRVELIVLDDGSTDATPDTLRAYGGRFRWESQTNMGQSATLNKGWGMARGDILGYLSADDVLRPQAVSEAVAALNSRPELVATYSDFDLIDEHSRSVRTVATRDFDARDLVLDLVCQPGPGAFFRREAFLRAGPWNPELRQNPDLDFWLRLCLVGGFLRIPKVLAGFRVHEGSATYQSTNIARADEPVLMTRRFIAISGLPDWITAANHRVVATGYVASAQLHLRAGRPVMAFQRICSAMRASTATLLSARAAHLLLSALIGRFLHRLRSTWVRWHT